MVVRPFLVTFSDIFYDRPGNQCCYTIKTNISSPIGRCCHYNCQKQMPHGMLLEQTLIWTLQFLTLPTRYIAALRFCMPTKYLKSTSVYMPQKSIIISLLLLSFYISNILYTSSKSSYSTFDTFQKIHHHHQNQRRFK